MTQDFAKRKPSAQKPEKSTAKAEKSSKRKADTRKANNRKPNVRKAAPAQKGKKRPPLWAWFATGIMVAGFAMFLSKLSQTPPNQSTNDVATEKPEKAAEKQSQVQFDFYQILKEHEVDVGEKAAAAAPKQENIHYYLQIASFKSPAEADTQRASIILLGLPANVEESTDKKGNTWYRVVAGPFDNRSRLAKARSILASERLNSLLIKRKPGA